MQLVRALCAALAVWTLAGAALAVEVRVAVVRVDYPTIAPISRNDRAHADRAFAGARLGQDDNATTGGFLGHTYETLDVAVAPDAADAAMDDLLERGVRLFVILARDADLLRLAERAGADALVFNAQSRDTDLRGAMCAANVLHVAPSNAMLTDAVVQFLSWKNWRSALLVHGSNPEDRDLADAYRASARKFGLKIVEEREFEDTGGARRTDSGLVLVQRQLPTFMQDTRRHEVVIAADASDVFGPYLPFHLWTPRPVVGSGGLRPVTFHAAHEAWGATQFQNRFEEIARRPIQEADYAAWLALRVIGEAVTRTSSADPATLRDYALGPDFEIAAFKGQPVTFRDWNGQLRQPILLYDDRITVSVSPQEGFLHQVSPLDTLGLDRSESDCTAFQ